MDITMLKKLLDNRDFSPHELEKFCCCICGTFLINFKKLNCEHLFCDPCIQSINKHSMDTVECPIDGTRAFKHTIKDGNSVKKLMTLELNCLYAKSGCRFVGTFAAVQQHVAKCHFVSIICPQGCKEMIPKVYLVKHLETQCPHRSQSCEYCHQDIILAEVEEHENECLLFPIHCPNQCGTELPRDKLKSHLSQCYVGIHTCKYSKLGCSFQGTKKKMTVHEEDLEHHMNLLMEFNMNQGFKFDQIISILQAQITELQNENLILKDKLDQSNEFVELIKGHVLTLSKKVIEGKKMLKDKEKSQEFNSKKDENYFQLERRVEFLAEDVRELRNLVQGKHVEDDWRYQSFEQNTLPQRTNNGI